MTDKNSVLINSELPLPVFVKGKVRDTYDLGKQLLIVATDRLSAFDVVLPCGIPDKGRVLNQISAYWFNETKKIIPNHVIEVVNDPKVLDKYLPAEQTFCLSCLSGRAVDDCQESETLAGRVRGARLSGRFGLGGISEKRHGFRNTFTEKNAGEPGIAGTFIHPDH